MSINFKKDQNIGKYKLIERLGYGGNGQVWKAKGDDGEVAIKILNSTDYSKYSFKRFKTEIQFLETERTRKGILNIIDYNLPEKYSKNNYAWYTMPVAVPLKKYFSETSLTVEEQIHIFLSLSNTLSLLHEKNIYHRDIKPDNLFWYNKEAVLSDFGLVTYPGKEDFTEGKKLGPLYYIAPEMLNTPDVSDASKADVYSLAKTLWVFLTNQNYPIQGEHDLNYQPNLISSFLSHHRVYLIDNLINKATKLDPSKRISMKEFNYELNEWAKKIEVQNLKIDLAEKAKEILNLMRPDNDIKDQRRILINKGNSISDRLKDLIEIEITDFIKEMPKQGWGTNSTILDYKAIFHRSKENKNFVDSRGFCHAYTISNPRQVFFWIGTGVEVFVDNTINLVVGFAINIDGKQEPIWVESKIVPIESSEMENAIIILLNGFKTNLPKAIDRFLDEMKK